MAWTEQCKIAFKVSAESKYWKAGNKGIIRILKELSKESDIPYKTLERWYYEKDPREDHDFPKNEDKSENKTIERPQCIRCHINPVAIDGKTKNPYNATSKYFGLCNSCRKMAIYMAKKDTTATCPHCHEKFKLTLHNINSN